MSIEGRGPLEMMVPVDVRLSLGADEFVASQSAETVSMRVPAQDKILVEVEQQVVET